jgi:hypothetical protein
MYSCCPELESTAPSGMIEGTACTESEDTGPCGVIGGTACTEPEDTVPFGVIDGTGCAGVVFVGRSNSRAVNVTPWEEESLVGPPGAISRP